MAWSYAYDPGLWPALITGALIVFIGWYSWRRRNMSGALSFSIASVFALLWTIGIILEIAAVDISAKIFWIKFQAVWQLPTATALFCFILQYAGLGRWLTRRNLIVMAIPPLLVLGLIITNDYHHLFWSQLGTDEQVIKSLGIANWFFFLYSYILLLVGVIVLIWLGVRSPQHRWPVAIILFGQLAGRGLYLFDRIYTGFLGQGGSILILLGLGSSMYALAFFRFHVFDPVPLARATAIEQMTDGMGSTSISVKMLSFHPSS